MVAHSRQTFSNTKRLLQGNMRFPKTNELRHPQVQRVATSIFTPVPLDTLKEIHTNFVRQTAWINKHYIASMSKSPHLTKIIYEIQNDNAKKNSEFLAYFKLIQSCRPSLPDLMVSSSIWAIISFMWV